jgi:hypothetical protein
MISQQKLVFLHGWEDTSGSSIDFVGFSEKGAQWAAIPRNFRYDVASREEPVRE